MATVGDAVGRREGVTTTGNDLGGNVGSTLGDTERLTEGDGVGSVVSRDLGGSVGSTLGDTKGFAEGDRVG